MKDSRIYALFVAALSFSSLTGCSPLPVEEGRDGMRSISVVIGDVVSRAADSAVSDGERSDYDNLYIYFTDGVKVLFSDVVSQQPAVADFKASGKVYDNITASVKEVVVLANVKPEDAVPTAIGTPVSSLKNYPFLLSAQQPSNGHSENRSSEGLKVTLTGSAKVVADEGFAASGARKMKAQVNLKPVVARMEIYGTPRPGTGLYSVRVAALYLNGYYTIKEFSDVTYYYTGQDIYHYGSNITGDVSILAEGDPLRIDAHHLFTNDSDVEIPHIVLALEGSYDDGAGGSGEIFSERYVTVTGYSGAPVMIGGNVYRIDLSMLTLDADMLDPVPEAGRVALTVAVEVEDWTEHESYPEV